jgi:hypothetical protein
LSHVIERIAALVFVALAQEMAVVSTVIVIEL